MDLRRLHAALLGVAIFGAASFGMRAALDQATSGYATGVSWGLGVAVLAPIAGGVLTRHGNGRSTLLVCLTTLAVLLLTATVANAHEVSWLAQLLVRIRDVGVLNAAAGGAFGAALGYALGPGPTHRRPYATAIACCWAAAVLAVPLATAWLLRRLGSDLFTWVALGALAALVAACLLERRVSTAVVDRVPADPGPNGLLRLLVGVAVLVALGPALLPERPVGPADLVPLYLVLAGLLAVTAVAVVRALGPMLAGPMLAGVAVVGTAYQVTALARVAGSGGRAAALFAMAGLAGAVAAVAAALMPGRVRRWLPLAGAVVAVPGLLLALAVANRPLLAVAGLIPLAVGAGMVLGAPLPDVNWTTASLAGALATFAAISGAKLAQGMRVLGLLSRGSGPAADRYAVASWLLAAGLAVAVVAVLTAPPAVAWARRRVGRQPVSG